MNELKYIIIEINHRISNGTAGELRHLFLRYPKEDVFYTVENDSRIKIYLNQLNFYEFKKHISSLTNLDNNTKQLFEKNFKRN